MNKVDEVATSVSNNPYTHGGAIDFARHFGKSFIARRFLLVYDCGANG